MSMPLRNRTKNVPMPVKPELAPVKRGASLAKKTNVDNGGDKACDEPKPKRQAMKDLSQVHHHCSVLSNVALNSMKKAAAEPSKIAPKQTRSLRQSSLTVKTQLKIAIQEEPVQLPTDVYEDPCPGYDYDKENAKDMSAVSDFADEIFRYYKYRERYFKVGDYLSRPHYFPAEVRAQLVDWMVECQETFELNHETLYMAVKLMDIYLDRTPSPRRETLQLVSCTAVLIAAKYDERMPPLVDDFIYVCEDNFTRQQMQAKEREILSTIGFDIGTPISYRFLRRFSRVSHTDMATLTLARYILELSLMVLSFCRVSESLMGAASLLLALRMKNLGGWTPVLQKYSGYRAEEVEPLMWTLNHMLRMRPLLFPRSKTIFRKYSHEIFYESAKVPTLPDVFRSADPIGPPPELLLKELPKESLPQPDDVAEADASTRRR